MKLNSDSTEKQAVRDRLAFDARFGAGSAERILAAERVRKIGELKTKTPAQSPRLYAKWITRLESDGFSAREISEVLGRAALGAPAAPSHYPTPAPASAVSTHYAPAPIRATTPAWDLPAMREFVDTVFGNGTAHKVVAHRTELGVKPKGEREQSEADVARLTNFLFSAGLNIPGLDFAQAELRQEWALSERQLAMAQRDADKFVAALRQTPDSRRDTSAVATRARDFAKAHTVKFN